MLSLSCGLINYCRRWLQAPMLSSPRGGKPTGLMQTSPPLWGPISALGMLPALVLVMANIGVPAAQLAAIHAHNSHSDGENSSLFPQLFLSFSFCCLQSISF